MENFIIKDMYEAYLKTNSDLTMGNVDFKSGDTVLHFENISEFALSEVLIPANAKGGYQNANLINWDSIAEVSGGITVGKISPLGMSVLFKTNLISKTSLLKIPIIEKLSTDENGTCVLKQIPDQSTNFSVYELNGGVRGDKIVEFTILENTLTIEKKYSDILVEYQFQYENSTSLITIGEKDLRGYFTFIGKFYYTDEITKEQKTALVEIPRVQINSNFNLNLGRGTNPFISNLYFKGLPIGGRDNRTIVNIVFLDKKI